jgi:Leucine-rich repeat (LRR) protein
MSFELELINIILNDSINEKEEKMDLQNYSITQMPDLHTYDWLKKLDLRNNEIKKLTKDHFPPNLKTFNIKNNFIKELTYFNFSESVTHLNASENKIESFDGECFINIRRLQLENNKLNSFVFPPNVKYVNISNNNLTELPDFPEQLLIIRCEKNSITELPFLNEKLKEINFSENEIKKIPDFPANLNIIDFSNNSINTIDNLPDLLTHLYLSDNKIETFEVILPENLVVLDISGNRFIDVPSLPPNIMEVDISNNSILEINFIPYSVVKFDCTNNRITTIPQELLERRILEIKYDSHVNKQICPFFNCSDDRFDVYQEWNPLNDNKPFDDSELFCANMNINIPEIKIPKKRKNKSKINDAQNPFCISIKNTKIIDL